MFQEQVNKYLFWYLGKYFYRFNKQKVNLDLAGGEVLLHDLMVKPNHIN